MENTEAMTPKKIPVWRRVLNIAIYVVIALLAAFVVFLFVSRMGGKTVFIGGKTVMWVMTDSMQNNEDPQKGIDPKTYILVEKVDPKTVEVGDVITFISDDPSIQGQLNTHRVIEVIGDHKEFRTQGDNRVTNPSPDKVTAKAENVVARYVRKLPALTALGRFFLTGGGLVVAFVVIIGITAAAFIPDLVKSSREKKAREQAETEKRIQEEIEKLKEQDRGNGPSAE